MLVFGLEQQGLHRIIGLDLAGTQEEQVSEPKRLSSMCGLPTGRSLETMDPSILTGRLQMPVDYALLDE